MKWNSSNQASFHFVWLEYNEGNQFLAQEKWSLVRNVTPHFPFKFFFKWNKYLYCSHFYKSHWVQNFISKSPAIQTSFRQRRWRKEEVFPAWWWWSMIYLNRLKLLFVSVRDFCLIRVNDHSVVSPVGYRGICVNIIYSLLADTDIGCRI